MQIGPRLLAEVQRALVGDAVQRVPEVAVGLDAVALVLDDAIVDPAAVQQQRPERRAGADDQRAAGVVQLAIDDDPAAVIGERLESRRGQDAAEADAAARADNDLAVSGHAAVELQQPRIDLDAAGVVEQALDLQLAAAGDSDAAFVADRTVAEIGIDAVGDVERSLIVEQPAVDTERPAQPGGAGIDRALVDDLVARVIVVSRELRVVAGLLQQQVRPQGQHRRAVAVVKIEVIPPAVRSIADVDRRVVQRLRAVDKKSIVLPGDQNRARTAAVGSGERYAVL